MQSKKRFGQNPLCAVLKGSHEIWGKTPPNASKVDHAKITDLLIKAGADCNQISYDYDHYYDISLLGSFSCKRYLNSETPLQIALYSGRS